MKRSSAITHHLQLKRWQCYHSPRNLKDQLLKCKLLVKMFVYVKAPVHHTATNIGFHTLITQTLLCGKTAPVSMKFPMLGNIGTKTRGQKGKELQRHAWFPSICLFCFWLPIASVPSIFTLPLQIIPTFMGYFKIKVHILEKQHVHKACNIRGNLYIQAFCRSLSICWALVSGKV